MTSLRRLLGQDLPDRLAADMASLVAPTGPAGPVTEDELAGLPATVERYFRFMGVVGRPRVRSFRARLSGRFRQRPGQRFMPAEIWQYDTVAPIARVFWMRIDFAGLIPMIGRDSYIDGRGRMLGKLLDTLVVADGEGERFDIGELTTWLNDAVLLAPSMLLDAGVTFRPVDDSSFEVELSDAGRTVRARVLVDADGAPVDFVTEDRFADLPGGLVRARWSTPVSGWHVLDGAAMPAAGTAVWHLPEGAFTYAEFAFDGLEANPLGAPRRRRSTGASVVDAAEGAARIAAMVVASPLLRRRYNAWGATPAERSAPMPGDELVPTPHLESTRAIEIDAPPERVWPWLVQIGRGRGGLYSYDALENLVGCDIRSADELLPDHQRLEPGDLVRLGPPGYPCFSVVSVDPGRSLVLLGVDPKTERVPGTPIAPDAAGATWQWVLRAVDGGHGTRLISRQRITYPASQTLLWRVVEPIGFVMERRMLLGIRDRAAPREGGPNR
ncbi:MAG: DUF6544 family protein [Actinomycetes bacterium]